ncbi:hypothetical protein HHI36_007779, partial [Cryptolaemus montrouzieri]
VNVWMNNNPSRNISRYQAGNIVRKAWTRAATPTKTTLGFRSSGIYSLDLNAIPVYYFLISDTASGEINPKQQHVNEDQAAQSNKSNDHKTTSLQPGTSSENGTNPTERSEEVFSFRIPARNSASSSYSSNIFSARNYCQEKKILSESKTAKQKTK